MDLKKLCESKNISLKILSKKSGVSISYLYQLQNGIKDNPSLKVAEKLADVLGITIAELMSN